MHLVVIARFSEAQLRWPVWVLLSCYLGFHAPAKWNAKFIISYKDTKTLCCIICAVLCWHCVSFEIANPVTCRIHNLPIPLQSQSSVLYLALFAFNPLRYGHYMHHRTLTICRISGEVSRHFHTTRGLCASSPYSQLLEKVPISRF